MLTHFLTIKNGHLFYWDFLLDVLLRRHLLLAYCIRFSSLYKLAGLFPKRIFKIQFTKMKSEDLRKLVLSKYKNGESSTKILEDLNGFVSSRTIRRWCQMVRETGSISSSHSPGRPRIIRTKGMIQKFKKSNKTEKRVSIRKLASELDISKSSVVRILKQDLGYRSYNKRVEPALTDLEKSKRMKFANWVRHNFRKEDTLRILFSDEKCLTLTVSTMLRTTEYGQ